MEIPENVDVIKTEYNLNLYHYDDQAEHPGPADYWKGVVMDDGQVVARSYPWAPTYITDYLSSNLVYTKFYESTLLRFYRVNGKPMVSTHKQIDISNKKSSIPGCKPFMELVKEAIKAWPYNEYEYDTKDGTGLAYTPNNWEALCVEGYCHVFLLIDISNQITDLTNLTESVEIPREDGTFEIVTFVSPRLIHAISYKADTPEMTPFNGEIVFRRSEGFNVEGDYSEHKWIVPSLELISKEEAEDILMEGGAVVGFHPETPDYTTKYFSEEYSRKLELVGKTFNPYHRWHELMDENPEEAAEYLKVLPYHYKHLTDSDMNKIYKKYLDESAKYVSDIMVQRYQGKPGTIPDNLTRLITDPVISGVRTLYKEFRNKPKDTILKKRAYEIAYDNISSLPYKTQHAIHGNVIKAINAPIIA